MAHKVYSFTAVTQYEFCPRQYHEMRVLKLHPYEQSEEAKWGEYVHKCLEDAINSGDPLPENVSQYQPLVTAVGRRRDAGWQIYTEQTFAIHNTGTGEITDAEDVWWSPKNLLAGNIDLLMVSPDGKHAVINDWKTNKSAKYAKPDQIALYALGVMLALPSVERVDGCLMFIVDGYKMVKSVFTRADIPRLMAEWKERTQRITLATVNNRFPEAQPTPLCGWCQCDTCPNWQQGQDFRNKRRRK